MQCFVTLDNGFTEGAGDPAEGILWLGWMRAASPIASRRLRAAEIRAQQLWRGLRPGARLRQGVAGANDCLKGPFGAGMRFFTTTLRLEVARQMAPVLERNGVAVQVPAVQEEGR